MRIWILAIATVAVLIGVAGGSYWYGGKGSDESALVLNRAPAASDGIKVHGDWTLTVSNPDGSVDSVHEFENAFVPGTGPAVLMWALKGEGVAEYKEAHNFRVHLTNSTGHSVCYPWNDDEAYQKFISVIMDGPSFTDTEAFQVKQTCTVKDGEYLIGESRLQGGLVSDLVPSYEGTPTNPGGEWAALTIKGFSPPVSIVPGQLVSTTVRITFE